MLQQLNLTTVNVELNPSLSSSNWLFVFDMDDLNGTEVKYFLVENSSNTRYYSFIVDTTTYPMKTGEWVLRIYEKSNNSSTDYSGLSPKFVGKVRIYKDFPDDFINTITLQDYRLN